MAVELPGWVSRHGTAHDDAESERYAAMTPQQRWLDLAQVCKLGARLLAANDRRDTVLELRDERSAESWATWRRLMRRPSA